MFELRVRGRFDCDSQDWVNQASAGRLLFQKVIRKDAGRVELPLLEGQMLLQLEATAGSDGNRIEPTRKKPQPVSRAAPVRAAY